MKKNIIFSSIFVVALLVSIFTINIETSTQQVVAQNQNQNNIGKNALRGWAWNDNIGWISLNNNTSRGDISFGVQYDRGTKNLSRNAWSDVVGWISFDGKENCRESLTVTECQPKINGNELSGFAYISSIDQFISLNCNNFANCDINYSVKAIKVDEETDTPDPAVECLDTNGESGSECITLKGWAWNDVIGWISFGNPTEASNSNLANAFINTSVSDPELWVSNRNPKPGQRIDIEWRCHDRKSSSFDGFNGEVGKSSGTETELVSIDKTFTVHCSDSTYGNDYASDSIKISAIAIDFTTTPSVIKLSAGQDIGETTLNWAVTSKPGVSRVNGCEITSNTDSPYPIPNDDGNVIASGNLVREVLSDTIYTITCTYDECTDENTDAGPCLGDSDRYVSRIETEKARVLILPGSITER